MTKSELIQLLAEKHADQHLYHRDYQRVVNRIFNEISDALAQGDRVELRGFRRVLGPPAGRTRGPQSAHGRRGAGRQEIPAVFQDRQGTARAAQPRMSAAA